MAYTTAQRDALQNAIALGAMTVSYGEKGSVTYRSLADMRSLLAEMNRAIGDTGGARPVRQIRIEAHKGYF